MTRPGSLDVVEDTVRREFDAQERRADAADTRAGLVLGFAGLVVSLGGGGWPPLALGARFLAAAAGVVALRALSLPAFHALDVRSIDRYLYADERLTRGVLLKSRPQTHAATTDAVIAKLALLRHASRLLIAALVLTLLAATLEAIA